MKVRVKAKVQLFEAGRPIAIGTVFETTEERARALGSSVEILGPITEDVTKPPKDRAIRRPRKRR